MIPPTSIKALTLGAATEKPNDPAAEAKREETLRKAAQDFEATFIAEMLAYAGFDKAVSSQSGLGGEAFSRMLIDSYAADIAKQGSFGLAEKIYRQLKDN